MLYDYIRRQAPCVECAVFHVTGNGCCTSAGVVLYEYVTLQEVAGTRTATLVFRDRTSWLYAATKEVARGQIGLWDIHNTGPHYLRLALDCDCQHVVCADSECLYNLLEPNFSEAARARACQRHWH